MYFVYIIECDDKSLYTGITTNLKRRFTEHQSGKGGNYTRSRKVVKFVFTEEHQDRSSASKREAEVKGWKKEQKLELINSNKRS